MGAAISCKTDLTQSEKSQFSFLLQKRYEELSKSDPPLSEAEIFNGMKECYELELAKVIESRVTASTTVDAPNPGHSQHLSLLKSSSLDDIVEGSSPVQDNFSYEDLSPTKRVRMRRPTERKPEFDIDTEFDQSQALMRSKTSSELLMDASTEEDEKIQSFILQLKAGDIVTKPASEFRTRRLTYAQKTAHEEPPPAVVPRITQKRTTIFASKEIGVVQEKMPPFPSTIMGTYSCHGIEPDEDDNIHEKINQDRGCVVYPFNSSVNAALFLVLDGHGQQGDSVSEFVMRQLVISLEKHPHLQDNPVSALKETFVKTNTALMVTPIEYMTSGCTCVMLYLVGSHLFIANVGDSRAVLATAGSDDSSSLKAIDLSHDHKPDNPDEYKRITEWGGYVCPAPEPGTSARVYLDQDYTMIGLAMSRSIGDYAVKSVGVIPEPDVFEHDIQPEDQFIIMASDGVWEFISSQEAVDIVAESLDTHGALDACQTLIEVAAERWQEVEGDYRDDITAIVIKLPLPMKSD